MIIVWILLAVIAWLLWLNYLTTDSFNEDLKQLRTLVGHIEKHLSDLIALEQQTSEQKTTEQDINKQILDKPLISINKASKNKLCSLPKIGNVLAQRIIDQRPYQDTKDILKLDGITDEMFSQLENSITL